MELKDYLRIARERWLTIVVMTLIGTAVALGVTANTTPIYESTARLFISTPQSDQTGEAYQGGLFSQQRVKSYASLLTGEEIAGRVIEATESSMSTDQLRRSIRARVEADTVVLSVTVAHRDPPEAQRLTQALAEEFVDFVAELETAPGRSVAPVKATIVDQATVPSTPVSPRPVRNLALGLLLGLLTGAGLAALRDTLDTHIRSGDDLDEATGGAAQLGHIQFDKEAAKKPVISGLDSYAPRVEAFRVLRTNLQFVNVDSARRAYVITSSVPAEGKSSTTCNLALSLSEAGHRVLLIEADMRRPKAADYLGLVDAVGLTSVLARQLGFDEALQTVNATLDVLASGPTPPNPAELLGSESMRELLRLARERYDVVLLDAPPLLPVTDAAIVSAEVDGAILVVRHGETTTDQVRGSVERLRAVDARLVGTVLTMTPRATRRRGQGGYGYGYGYGYAPSAPGSPGPTAPPATPTETPRAGHNGTAPAGELPAAPRPPGGRRRKSPRG